MFKRLLTVSMVLVISSLSKAGDPSSVALNTIQVRDPFVVPVAGEGRYYLFGTTDKDCWGPAGTGFDVYRSADLVNWEGPLAAFRPPEGFWGTRNFWAPEAHRLGDSWFLFASFKNDRARRGTAILRADRPEGPYRPHSDGAVTPHDWECLDGTLFIESDGRPWMVFCHEWVQVGDGEMCAIPLTRDLHAADGEPVLLFRASEAPWTRNAKPDRKSLVTDGPFLHRTASGRLLMLWSTIGPGGYTMGLATSDDGTLRGPWRQQPEPLFSRDGGHGMIFRTFDGRLMLTLHQPNKTPNERAQFFELEETSDGLLRLKASAEKPKS
ncbi:MAG: glycoside hydrolase family 43 protein [Nibricoccus sp.]